jgi:hypothetical protein
MASIKTQREEMIRSGGLDSNALLGSSYDGKRARWIVSSDLPSALDAGKLVERIADVVLEAHRSAIEAGVRADGSGSQPPLDPKGASGRAALRGERPSLRGVTQDHRFPQGLRRRSVRFSGVKLASGREGTRAKTRIVAPSRLRLWLAQEGRRGVRYFYVGGTIAALVQAAVLAWTRAEVLAKADVSGPRERRAPKQGPKLPPKQGPKLPPRQGPKQQT